MDPDQLALAEEVVFLLRDAVAEAVVSGDSAAFTSLDLLDALGQCGLQFAFGSAASDAYIAELSDIRAAQSRWRQGFNDVKRADDERVQSREG